jgi:hypothetical protein
MVHLDLMRKPVRLRAVGKSQRARSGGREHIRDELRERFLRRRFPEAGKHGREGSPGRQREAWRSASSPPDAVPKREPSCLLKEPQLSPHERRMTAREEKPTHLSKREKTKTNNGGEDRLRIGGKAFDGIVDW